MPFFFEAAILSRMRSAVISRSNWAKDNSTFSISRPIEVVVLNCWVTETKETPCASKSSARRSDRPASAGVLEGPEAFVMLAKKKKGNNDYGTDDTRLMIRDLAPLGHLFRLALRFRYELACMRA